MSKKPNSVAIEDPPAAHPHNPLPNGWIQLRLGDLTIRSEYGTSTRCDYGGATTPVLRIPNIARGEIDVSDLKRAIADIHLGEGDELQPGDMLICRTNGSLSLLGKAAVIRTDFDSPFSFASYLLRFRFAERDVLPRWIHFFVSSVGRAFIERNAASSAGQHNISLSKLHSMPLPLASLNEQKRIVAKIEELFSDLDAGVAALKRAKANLKRYRAAVLKAAVEGKLTEEWRAKHPKTEPASKLLERILTERRKKWEADQLAKFAASGKQPPQNWREKYVEQSPPDTTGLPELPAGWCWASVDQTSEVQGGIQKQPKRAPGANSFPFLRVANVHRNRLELDEVHRVELFDNELERLRLQPDDLLVVEGNGSKTEIGRSAIWNGEIQNCVHQNHIIRVRFLAGSSRYLNAYWNSPTGNSRVMEQAASTSGLYTLSVTKICSLPIPLAPVIEQQEIVVQVEERLSVIAAAETEINHSLLRANRLRQSILKQAFEGKLVAQDAADEAASVLLARIQQERSSANGTPKRSSKQTKETSNVFLRRAAVVSYTVQRLAQHRSFGRTQLEKTLHLTQSHLGVDLGLAFARYPAGPFDKTIYKLEGVAKKKEWFTTQKRLKFGVTYHPGSKIDQMCRHAVESLGSKLADFDRLLDHVSKMNTDEAELLATTYAAWNDLLIDGRSADEKAIITEVHGWHARKEKFTPQMIRTKLRWMRTHGYIPTGQGQRTILMEMESKLKSHRVKKKTERE